MELLQWYILIAVDGNVQSVLVLHVEWGIYMSTSFIPVICPDCGGALSRVSVYNRGVVCLGCDKKFRLVKIK